MIQKRPEISISIIGQFSVRRTLFLLTLNAIFSKVLSIFGCFFTHSNTTISTWCSVHSIHSIQDFDNEDHSKLLSSLQVQATALSLIWSVIHTLLILGATRKL